MHISNIGFYSFFKLFDYYSFDVWMCIWGCSFHEIIEPIGIRPLTAHTYTCIYKYMDLESLAIHPSKSIWTGQYRKNRTMKTIFKTLFYTCKIFRYILYFPFVILLCDISKLKLRKDISRYVINFFNLLWQTPVLTITKFRSQMGWKYIYFFLGCLCVCLREAQTASIPTPKWMSPCGPPPLTETSRTSPKTISLQTAYSWLYENAVKFHNVVSTLLLKYVRIPEIS